MVEKCGTVRARHLHALTEMKPQVVEILRTQGPLFLEILDELGAILRYERRKGSQRRIRRARFRPYVFLAIAQQQQGILVALFRSQ